MMVHLQSKTSGGKVRGSKHTAELSVKYNVIDYETNLPPVRMKQKDVDIMESIVAKDYETYDSVSHYVRCAIIRLNRQEKKRLRL